MKFVIRLTLLLFSSLVCFTAQAAPIFILDGTGHLTGAKSVSVSGILYDVVFVDGTCAAVFGACDQAHFAFTTANGALAAGQSLLDTVFVDGSAGNFDSHPELTAGCPSGNFGQCNVYTPYGIFLNPLPTGALLVATGNLPVSDFNAASVVAGFPEDTGTSSIAVWARWTASVPEPTSIVSLGLGILALVSIKRRGARQSPRP